jgi:uncharacterized protein YhdP
MLVVALFQVSGRLMFTVLDELEVGVNQWLSPQQVVLSGLEGDWRGINPIVNVERVEMPAGYLEGVHVEIDWLESLIRNRLVARRISLTDGRLELERTDEGWRLVGASGGAAIDPFDTVYHSDVLDVGITVGFVGSDGLADARDDVDFRYKATNRGGLHAHRLTVTNSICEASCAVEMSLDELEAILFVRPRTLAAKASGTGLRVPTPLLGRPGGRLAAVTGRWWRDAEDSAGELSLSFGGLEISEDDSLNGGLSLQARGVGDVQHLEVVEGFLESKMARWQMPDLWLTYEAGSLKGWTGRIETGAGFEFLAALVPRDTAVYRWLSALRVRAIALNVHGFVRIPSFETGLSATVRDVSLDGYNGAPWIRGGAGELLGANRSVQLTLNAQDLSVQFPDIFHQRWVMDHLNGHLKAFIGSDYFGLRGTNLRAEINGSRASGGFALSRPNDRYRERLTLLINVDETTVARGKQFIPYRLPAGLPEWLESGPRSGSLEQVAMAYHGQIHTRPFELARRVEFAAQIFDGDVQYHPDWPVVNDLSGRIAVAGRDVRIGVDEGTSLQSTDLSGSRIRLGDNATYADIDLVSQSSVDEALAFVRTTPLAEWMAFVTPDWAGAGNVKMAGQLHIPLKLGGDHIGEESFADQVGVDLDIELFEADLDLPGYGVFLGDLVGDLRYIYPYGVSGTNVRGRIFGRPAIFAATSDEDTVIFHVDGQAPYEDVLSLLDVTDPGVIRGGFDFIADLHIEMADSISRLDVVSDLTGLALDLPGEFSKAPDEAVPSELELRFLDAYQSVRFRYGPAQGWLHVAEVPLRGAIGFSSTPPMVDTANNELVLGGRIEGFSVEQVVPDGGGGPALAIPIRLADLGVGLVDVNGIGFRDAVLGGRLGAGDGPDVMLNIESPDLTGRLKYSDGEPLELDLALLRLPEGEDDGTDPLEVQVIGELLDADIKLSQLLVGEKDYGSWSFQMRPTAEGLELNDLNAQLRGIAIEADRMFWDSALNRSFFDGTMQAGDLAEVLPQWDFAASVTTESASMEASLNWQGSPAAVDLDLLVGQAAFEASNGRFLEVTAGGTDAMRIFSLVNFSTIAKRLNFDFSDVVGEGVSFDTLTATSEFNEGMMQFIEPMTVDGSGSSFKIAGKVDLVEGTLDNEMIVTLPVTKGLPWYAAYIALANPLAGLGVLVGERVLRKPLEQFSSAKYEISGTLEEPELNFVGVWDTSMDQPQVSLEQLEVDDLENEPGEDEKSTESGASEIEEEAVSQNTESTTG